MPGTMVAVEARDSAAGAVGNGEIPLSRLEAEICELAGRHRAAGGPGEAAGGAPVGSSPPPPEIVIVDRAVLTGASCSPAGTNDSSRGSRIDVFADHGSPDASGLAVIPGTCRSLGGVSRTALA